MRLVALVLAAVGAVSVPAAEARRAPVAVAGCPATKVHYGRTAIGTPWAANGAVTANLFYYTRTTRPRVDTLRVYVGGKAPDGTAAKILWTVSGRDETAALKLTARRFGNGPTVRRVFPSAGSGQFPSLLQLPAAGCWQLAVRAGHVRARFVVLAVAR